MRLYRVLGGCFMSSIKNSQTGLAIRRATEAIHQICRILEIDRDKDCVTLVQGLVQHL